MKFIDKNAGTISIQFNIKKISYLKIIYTKRENMKIYPRKKW
jgi:hypothetical protein